MHSVHAVYCSSKGHPELPTIILEFYMNLKVSCIGDAC